MSNRQIRAVAIIVFLLLSVMAPNIVGAKHPSTALTPLEQSVWLSNVASQMVVGRPHQHHYRSAWVSASLSDRVRLAERIGNEGATRYATKRGLAELLGSRGRNISQGPDFVYLSSNRVRVIEAKGGSSQPKWTYGSRQGTNINTIRSAKFVLKSAQANQAEKRMAALIIRAAQKNRLETGVVKTPHVSGRPEFPRLQGSWNRKDVSKEAFRIERELRRNNPHLAAKAFNGANVGRPGMASMRYVMIKGMRYVGRYSLPVAIGVEGWMAWTAYHAYTSGLIGQSEFYHRIRGPAMFVASTGLGAIVGGILGEGSGRWGQSFWTCITARNLTGSSLSR